MQLFFGNMIIFPIGTALIISDREGKVMLSIEDFIIEIYCRTDDSLKEISRGIKLRSRGFPPSLSDSEVITMEIVGEYLGIDTDKGIWEYFRRHWSHFFSRSRLPDNLCTPSRKSLVLEIETSAQVCKRMWSL